MKEHVVADEVLVEFSGRMAVITINRPQARNAVNYAVSAGGRPGP